MTVKIWGIKTLEHLTAAKSYNENDKKTLEKEDVNPYDIKNEIQSTKENLKQKTLQNLFKYAVNSDKTVDTIKHRYVSGYLCNPVTAIEEFMLAMNKRLAATGKEHSENDNVAFHIVQSFPPDVNLSNEEIHQCGIELCEKMGKYQGIICSHINPVTDENGKVHGACKHNHIIINAYSSDITQNKYHDSKHTYFCQLQKWNDEIAKAHNQPIILTYNKNSNKSVFEDMQIKNKSSWKEDMRQKINSVKAVSTDWESFKTNLQKADISIREGKYITYTSNDGHKARDKRLGAEYSKESIENYFRQNKELEESLSGISADNTTPLDDNTSDISLKISPPTPIFYTDKRMKNKPYKIRMYDENGRKRSTIELIILLAVTILEKLSGQKQLTEVTVYTDKRLQTMIDAISLARREGIENKDILSQKLAETGREISTLKKIISKSELAKQRMDSVNIIINDFISFRNEHKNLFTPDGEKLKFFNDSERTEHQEILERYKLLRGMLHRSGIHTGKDIDNFQMRYDSIRTDIERYKKGLSELSRRYGQLKSVERTVIQAEEISQNEGIERNSISRDK